MQQVFQSFVFCRKHTLTSVKISLSIKCFSCKCIITFTLLLLLCRDKGFIYPRHFLPQKFHLFLSKLFCVKRIKRIVHYGPFLLCHPSKCFLFVQIVLHFTCIYVNRISIILCRPPVSKYTICFSSSSGTETPLCTSSGTANLTIFFT